MFKSIAAFIAAAAFSISAAASTYSIDYTDLWGGGQPVPTENGWGLNLIQQGDVIFATMFVYGSDNTARWFSASSLSPSGGGTVWSGTLAQTTGTYYGAPWAGNAAATAVGNMTLSFSNANTGNLTYTVNGVTVNKAISRFSLRGANLGGHYLGGAVATCNNGGQVLIFDDLRVTQSGSTVQMAVNFFTSRGLAATCTYGGTMTTTGRTGSIGGSYSCSGDANNAGTFTITNLESTINGFNGNLNASDQFCTGGMTGRFGGVKDVLP
jgi:hypothetical protein